MNAINDKTLAYAKEQAKERLEGDFKKNEDRIRDVLKDFSKEECLNYLSKLKSTDVNPVEIACTAYVINDMFNLEEEV